MVQATRIISIYCFQIQHIEMLSDLASQKNTCKEPKGQKRSIFACAVWPWRFVLLLLMLLSSSGFSGSRFVTPTAESTIDHLALLAFKSLLSDPSGALASWHNSSLHFCQWRGVRCRNRGGEMRVTTLSLESLQLPGALSPFLANLTFLQRLHLPNNSLHGSIPQELGFLSRLRDLNLSTNALVGMIPTSLFQNCSKLQNFSLNGNNLQGTVPRNISNCFELLNIVLDHNMLEGAIPSSLYSFSKLQTLVLWNNNLRGSIPPGIGKLASLKRLFFSSNHLKGTIPAEIGNLSSLTWLDLSNNHLSGAIPTAISNLSSLGLLMLFSNNLTGAIPSDIGSLSGLTELHLYYNQLTATIPSEIGNLVNLTTLFLGGNRLDGTIPKSLGSLKNLDALIFASNNLEARNAAEWSFVDSLVNCTRLRVLDISVNHLGGILPKSIANLSRTLTNLHFHDNQIAGSIPVEIGDLMGLTEFLMYSNLLKGTIPPSLGSLRRLVRLDFHKNYFVGEIPTTLGNITGLTSLLLSSNELYGFIPGSLGKCRLDTLDLASNNLAGTVPKEVLSIPTLTKIFNVSHNSLTGSLPPEIGNLGNIQTIDVSYNSLSGEIPSSIAYCEVLQYLYMQRNFFQGSIPSFSQLKGLQVLDLSRNNLSGHIPDFLRSFLDMSYLNLSYNNLDGEVPKDGVFSNVNTFSVFGNNQLCGGIPELSLPSCPSRKKHLSWKIFLIIGVAGGILCAIFLTSLFTARYWLHKLMKHSSVTSSIKEQHRKVSFAELFKATNEFSPDNLIGMGSFGSVYKGTMDWEDNKDVAVKVLNLQQKGASGSFLAECEALRNIRHRNLVKVLTSCSGVDFHGNDFKALVYEFLPNGSLDKWLYPKVHEDGRPRKLSLIQRLNISIDVAFALGYLHHHVPTSIVHCDIKPSNILLDDNMVAHLSDFGLARFLNKAVGKSSQRWTKSITMKGSIGYAAPEYGIANKVSTQGDVYSYGTLLLEMFTGKRPTDDCFKEGMNLHQYVAVALPEQAVEIIDPPLLFQGDEEAASFTNVSANEIRSTRAVECITSVLRVGVLCSKESPKARMHMDNVIKELEDTRDAFLRFNPLQV